MVFDIICKLAPKIAVHGTLADARGYAAEPIATKIRCSNFATSPPPTRDVS